MVDHEDESSYSDDGRYRWWFRRSWADRPGLCWVGLNPSTGDTTGRPRPTLRKVVARANAMGLGSVTVVNLFAWRCTRPRDLWAAAKREDVIGAENDDVIRKASEDAAVTLAAWGAHGRLLGRGASVLPLLHAPVCLGVTARGEPRHPLYVPGDRTMEPYLRP